LARLTPDNENMPDELPEEPVVDFMDEAPQTFEAPAAVRSEQPEANSDWSAAPLGGLGLVQLVQRLGSSLEKRRELVGQAAAAAAAPALEPTPAPAELQAPPAPLPLATSELFEAAAAEEAAQAMAAYFGRPASAAATPNTAVGAAEPIPAPLSKRMAALAATSWEPEDDEEEADDLAASFELPLRRSTQSFLPPESADAEEPAEGAQGEEERFGSLLNIAPPFAARSEEFVRVEERAQAEDEPIQPAVVFPGRETSLRAAPAAAPAAAAPANAQRMFDRPSGEAEAAAPAPKSPPADADEALRRALATLQRMSSSG
jgi:hypothetical protein